ncbi:MAG: hypothetical protein EOP05_00595 [Proteobacteria bacterium]|nr:MAG: hypothetical protein EOP05_00595 [Pseudomonadota bacterium]
MKIFNALVMTSVWLVSINHSVAATRSFDLKSQVETYKLRYGLRDPNSKLVNNTGDGYGALYGVRNFRVVLHGVYYRGGANNVYNKNLKRKNTNPLQGGALTNLCEEGFKEAVYLYTTNYSSAPKEISCKITKTGEPNRLTYHQLSALGANNEEAHLKKIYSHIKGIVPGPIYDHCWNGWHASGYVAAITLRQFCGYSASEADAYWVRNTDGHESGMNSIRKKIRSFKPLPNLSISKTEQNLICP